MTTAARHAQARALLANEKAGTFRAETSKDETVDKLYLYAPIGGWFGVYPEEVVQALSQMTGDTVELHVNSPGGIAFDGVAIMNALRQHDARVVAYVDGLAASAASIVILGADEIVMSPGAELMIHDASALCFGTAADMAKTAADVDKLSQNMAGLYARRAGGTADDWRTVMLAETWYTASEAVEAGLADRVDDDAPADVPEDAPAQAAWDLSMFAHAGRGHAPAPQTPAAATAAAATRRPTGPGSTPPSAHGGTTEGSDAVTFTNEQLTDLRNKLGVTDADADGPTILAALDEALAEGADPAGDRPAAPEGMELVDSTALAQMREDAAAGREARNEQLAAHRVAAVDAAVNDGRIPPARRDAWIAQLAADPGAETTLNSLAAGLVNTTESGHAGSVDLDDDRKLAQAVGWGNPDDDTKGA